MSHDSWSSSEFADLQVRYQTHGSGQPLVLIHGLGQDHRIWQGVQERCSEYMTLAYDLRGHAGTSLGHADGTIAQLADDLIRVLDSTGPAFVAGFSLGGTIALWAASERTDLFRGCIAIATSSVVGATAAAGLAERIELFEAGDEEAIRQSLLLDTISQLAGASVDPEPIAASRAIAVGSGEGYVNGARAVISMRGAPLQDRLSHVRVPVLVISGELDPWCPRRAAEIMMEGLPQSQYIELPQAGHLITDVAEEPLVRAMTEWMKGIENGS